MATRAKRPADLYPRLSATLFDSTVFFTLWTVGGLTLARVFGAENNDVASKSMLSLGILALLACVIAYVRPNGVTPGRSMYGVQVVRLNGREYTPGFAFWRDLFLKSLCMWGGLFFAYLEGRYSWAPWIMLMPLIFPLIAFGVTPFLNSDRRALHDWIAGTMVVATDAR